MKNAGKVKGKAVIFDDDEIVRAEWVSRLRSVARFSSAFEVVTMNSEEFRNALEGLYERQEVTRAGDSINFASAPNAFDDAKVIFIDYDLFAVFDRIAITGEEFAYLARCYSTCGLIIGINQFGDNVFDLTLRGHPESFADLNIGISQIENVGLWANGWKSFRPWHWPLVPAAVRSFEARSAQLVEFLDEPILGYLGFPHEIIPLMPRSTLEFIEAERDVTRTTFREFVMNSGKGLRGKDAHSQDVLLARVAAARIWKWLERIVLPGQAILVDAPHLVYRFPSLLKGSRKKAISTWNKLATLGQVDLDLMNIEAIDSYLFRQAEWLSRAAWFWPQLSDCADIEEVRDPWSMERPDIVFCEDVSAFMKAEHARSFVAEVDSPFVQRFVLRVEGINYKPSVRFAL